MVRLPGSVRETVYSGPTTTYLIEIAPGVSVAVLEQNTDRSRNEERWTNGQRVELGWRPEHCLVLA
jgi:spermidine/putrescine transport system ATP-binding protein